MDHDIVYSTDAKGPPPCPRCGKNPCACPKAAPAVKTPAKQAEPVLVRLERSGRAGKTVTLIEGLRMHPEGREDLLKRFKKRCGAGGAHKEGRLEIQGDHRHVLKAELEKLGYRVTVGN